jgi:polysaccharide export outer membrane protein
MAAFSALALSGCMHRPGPVATAPLGTDLDSMAYGPLAPNAPPSSGMRPSRANAPGAIAALSNSFAYMPSPSPTMRPEPGAQPGIVYGPPTPRYNGDYRLDSGDRLRVVVYGQEGLTNVYAVGANGSITMPLIGSVSARGQTPSQLARTITARLRNGYIREPSVSAEIESYRPFFILGEVAAPGQYPFVPNMTAESAVAIAGGYSPRARRDVLTVTHPATGGSLDSVVSPNTPISPGDTVVVGERWF